ncbi:hypothetical protein JCM33374_g1500 [Metschnikowia sp. JCM 33374]|nr:hypothetical protein JCM33374_g1500 [Metschnikowia sp. JCM 33374]
MIQNGLIKDHPHINYDINMRIYLHNLTLRLGRRLNVRQIALSSSEIYLTRFLSRVSIKEVNVYLLVTTCLYVACKIEECPQHIRLIVSEARNLWPEYIPQDVSKLAEFEFYLIEEMDMFLVLHHPYRSLLQVRDFLQENSSMFGFTLSNVELQHSWSLINDSYITDLHLVFPPHVIAMAAIYITIVLEKRLNAIRAQGPSVLDSAANNSSNGNHDSMHIDDLISLTSTQNTDIACGLHPEDNLASQRLDKDTLKIEKFMDFFNYSHVNLDEVIEAMQEMISLYFAWNNYNESSMRRALSSMLLNR